LPASLKKDDSQSAQIAELAKQLNEMQAKLEAAEKANAKLEAAEKANAAPEEIAKLESAVAEIAAEEQARCVKMTHCCNVKAKRYEIKIDWKINYAAGASHYLRV